MAFKVFKKDDYVIISRTFEIEKWEYDFWRACEKAAWENVLRFFIRQIFAEIISLDVTRPNSVFQVDTFLLVWAKPPILLFS